MFERRIPDWLRQAPAPTARGFAIMTGLDAVTRGLHISAFPLVMYDALRDTASVSAVYFVIGIASLATGLSVP